MAKRSPVLSAILLAVLGASARAEDPPPAPEGYSWKKLDSVKAAFLMPQGWYFKQEGQGDTRAFFLTQEDIDTKGEFETGLSLNVVRLKKDKAPERAALFIAQLTQTPGHELQDTWKVEAGVLQGLGARFRQTEKGYPPVIKAVLAIGNSRTNTLYLLVFESPESNWKAAWAKGDTMLKDFLLDDEY